MLNKELSHFSESSKSGNQISEYICSTFLGEFHRLLIYLFIYLSKVTQRITTKAPPSMTVVCHLWIQKGRICLPRHSVAFLVVVLGVAVVSVVIVVVFPVLCPAT